MATSQLSEVIQHLRRAMLLHDGAGLTDGQLLECFIERRDEAAFAALVRRHGPMVWGVCRRVLNHHDAEDAFQAAFLVLFRKATSILPREMMANWLYGVAHQTALQARRTAGRRRARERQVTEMPELEAVQQEDLWRELQPLLDEELSRLPDKYRVVLVLCDLEEKTRKEVARQLGLTEGTVASRLARARTMLARRLARHGLAVSGGSLAMVLSQNAASASVPTPVVSYTIKAASACAAGKAAMAGVISAKVATMMEGVMKAMLLSKLKIVMAVLVVGLLIAGVGTGAFNYRTQPAEQTQVEVQDEQPKKASDKPLNQTNKVVIYLPRVIENLGSPEFRADLEAAMKRLPSVKVTPNTTDRWMAEVEFDPGKVDVGEVAKALASVKVPARVGKEPAATLVLPATITEKQQEKIGEALAKVKGVDSRRSCYWQPLKAVLVVLDEKGGARIGQIIAALKHFGITIQEQEPLHRPKGGYSIKLFGGDLTR